jgi:Trm5-related predicted tRNA methylase
MKKIIELVKKFLFGSKVEKAVVAAQVVKEVKKTAAKPAAGKKKK